MVNESIICDSPRCEMTAEYYITSDIATMNVCPNHAKKMREAIENLGGKNFKMTFGAKIINRKW